MRTVASVAQRSPSSGHGAGARTPYHPGVAYDEELAVRIREVITGSHAVTERKMFRGLAFMVGGHMAVAAGSEGGLMVRVDPTAYEGLLASTEAQEMVMRGRPMSGWLLVPAAGVRIERQLRRWVEVGAGYAGSLPPKPPKAT